MKALISAFALLSFVAASTVPLVAQAQTATPPAAPMAPAAKSDETMAPAKAPAKMKKTKKAQNKKSHKKMSKKKKHTSPATQKSG